MSNQAEIAHTIVFCILRKRLIHDRRAIPVDGGMLAG